MDESQKPPTRLGGFKLGKPLGRGGMGQVYRAYQVTLDRWVAVKLLPKELQQKPGYAERFRAEARAAAKLDHPNIVRVLEAGEVEGQNYFAMELVEGQTAAQQLRGTGVFNESDAVGFGMCVAAALGYAWKEAKLIHRDIKPENILIRARDGQVKLADLGLAKSFRETPGHSSLTTPGAAVGTPNYISPEQAQGRADIDFRTDMYSLGATLYHLVAGKPPFHGDEGVGLFVKHITAPFPDLRQHRPDISEGFCLVLEKMVAKDPKDRYASWELLLQDFDALQKGLPPVSFGLPAWANVAASSPPKPTQKSRAFKETDANLVRWILVAFVACVASIWFFTRPGSSPTSGPAPSQAPVIPTENKPIPPPTPLSPSDPGMPEWSAELRRGVTVRLFNGRNFVGWTPLTKGWRVQNGIITVESADVIQNLVCNLPVDDFELSWQMCLVGEAKAGVDFRSIKGHRYTILLDSGDRLALERWESGKDVVTLAGPVSVSSGWHRLRLIAQGASVTLECDGVPTLRADSVPSYGQTLRLSCTKGSAEFKEITIRSLETSAVTR